jgi:negative regulator of sigma E activity
LTRTSERPELNAEHQREDTQPFLQKRFPLIVVVVVVVVAVAVVIAVSGGHDWM